MTSNGGYEFCAKECGVIIHDCHDGRWSWSTEILSDYYCLSLLFWWCQGCLISGAHHLIHHCHCCCSHDLPSSLRPLSSTTLRSHRVLLVIHHRTSHSTPKEVSHHYCSLSSFPALFGFPPLLTCTCCVVIPFSPLLLESSVVYIYIPKRFFHFFLKHYIFLIFHPS
jgi:hypothetical protein